MKHFTQLKKEEDRGADNVGKPTGFMEYERQDKPAESPKERIKHFREFHTPLSKEEQVQDVWRVAFRSARQDR